ncbi:MAG TPA: ATP12 family protein [Bauldia sp.]|nr:ATP12 family protein [Bauldia sp.]
MSNDGKNPMSKAQQLARPVLPRRFYQQASVGPHEGGYAVLLDGRVAKTPARKPLVVSRRDVAEALAAEWEAQSGEIHPATMPLTRLVNSAIDRVTGEMAAVRDDIVKHAASDMLFYRAEGPQSLIDIENRLWTPILTASERALGIRFVLSEGIVHVSQDPAVLAAVARAVEPFDALSLAALHSVTTLTGSALIALAVARGDLTVAEAWEAAHADEDWQMSHWGRDDMALSERADRWREMEAAAFVLGVARSEVRRPG